MYEIILDLPNRSNLFNFYPLLNCFCRTSYRTTPIQASFSILTRFWMVFVWNNIRSLKLKQAFKFSLGFESYLYEIVLDHANRSNLFNFDFLLNGFCMKSYQTTQIEATGSILTGFWIVFVWSSTRQYKSKNLFNFDSFLNAFCMKSFQTTQIEEIFHWTTQIKATFLKFGTFLYCFYMKSS